MNSYVRCATNSTPEWVVVASREVSVLSVQDMSGADSPRTQWDRGFGALSGIESEAACTRQRDSATTRPSHATQLQYEDANSLNSASPRWRRMTVSLLRYDSTVARRDFGAGPRLYPTPLLGPPVSDGECLGLIWRPNASSGWKEMRTWELS